MKLHTKQLQTGMNSAVVTQLLPHPKIPLMVISQKRFLKRSCISVIIRHY